MLTAWPKYTEETHILLHSDSLLTVMEPTDKLRDAYLKKIGKTLKDFAAPPVPELLNEDEQHAEGNPDIPDSVVPPGNYYEEDEFEPNYRET